MQLSAYDLAFVVSLFQTPLCRIVAENSINDCIIPESVKVFRFDLEYNLTQEEASALQIEPTGNLCFPSNL